MHSSNRHLTWICLAKGGVLSKGTFISSISFDHKLISKDNSMFSELRQNSKFCCLQGKNKQVEKSISRTRKSIPEANIILNCHTIMKTLCKVYHHRNKEIPSMFTVCVYFCLHLVFSNVFLQSPSLHAFFHLVTNYMLSQNPVSLMEIWHL